MTAPLALFIVADLLMHLESLGFAVPTGLGWRLAVGAPIVLISVIGGRIIPSFTRNWLFKRKSPRLPSPQDMLDTAAVGLLAAALILWAFLPDHRVTGALLIAAALLNAVRLSRWTGIATWAENHCSSSCTSAMAGWLSGYALARTVDLQHRRSGRFGDPRADGRRDRRHDPRGDAARDARTYGA